MKYKEKAVNQCTKQFSVELDSEAIQQAYSRYYDSIQQSASVPGFRKGRVPRNILENHYKDDAKEPVLQQLIASHTDQILKEKELNPFGNPSFTEVDFKDDSLKFTFQVEFKPEFDLKKYKNVSVKKTEIKVDSKEVDEQIDQIRAQYATQKAVEDRAAKEEDFIVADTKCVVGEEVLEDRKDAMMELSDKQLLPDYIKNVVGMKIDDEKTFDIKFPDDMMDKKISGQTAQFTVKLKEIKEKVLPEVDEEFLKMVGAYDKVQDFKEAIEKDIRKRKEDEEDMRIEKELLDTISGSVKFDLPQSIIHQREEGLIKDRLQHLAAYGMSEDQIAGQEDQLRQTCRAEAERQVKVAFILDKIAALENIEATEEDVSEKIYSLSRRIQKSVDEIRDYYEQNHMMESLKSEIRSDKTLKLIKSNANYK